MMVNQVYLSKEIKRALGLDRLVIPSEKDILISEELKKETDTKKPAPKEDGHAK